MSDTAAPANILPSRIQRRGILICLIAVALIMALPFVAGAAGYPSATTLATRIAILAIAAVSLNLALGFGGMVSFGHAAYYGIGAYAAGILTQAFAGRELVFGVIPGSDQLLVTIPAAMLVGAATAAIFGALSLRTSGIQFIMITLAFAQMLFFLFVSLKTYGGDDGMSLRRRNGLFGLDMRNDMTFYFVSVGVLMAWLYLLSRITRSRFGQVLDGIRQNPRRMAAIGVSTYSYRLVAFIIAGAGAGLAGGLMANFAKFVSPDMMHWTQSGEFLIMIVIGGVGTLIGPAIGAAILIVLESTLASWTEHWQIILGPILICIVLFWRPKISALLSRRPAP